MADGAARPTKVTCREIGPDTLAAAEKMLNEGFPERSPAFWARAIARLSARRVPEGYPRYGYVLLSGGTPVGCLLTIFSSMPSGTETAVRCNLSAFYAQPRFRPYASLLTLRALRHAEVTYLNISPRPATLPLLQAQGYQRYCEGSLVLAPWLLPPRAGLAVARFQPLAPRLAGLTEAEHTLLADHAGLGCVCLVASRAGGVSPYVFQHRRIKRLLPATQLLYCRSIEDFAKDAGTLGRHLAGHGSALMLVDTDGGLPALPGRLIRLPKFFKGPRRPRLGDLAYTELTMLGI